MKTFREFTQSQSPNKIVISKQRDTMFRDGGSHGYYVKNTEECGFSLVIQDFSIGAKRKGTEGGWFATLPAPNHIEHHPIEYQQLVFV